MMHRRDAALLRCRQGCDAALLRLGGAAHPMKYAFFVSQCSEVPTCGSISFCRMARAYSIRFSRATPCVEPRLPM